MIEFVLLVRSISGLGVVVRDRSGTRMLVNEGSVVWSPRRLLFRCLRTFRSEPSSSESTWTASGAGKGDLRV